MSFMLTEETKVIECCPGCVTELEVNINGTSVCHVCGNKDILPCSVCTLLDEGKCDWSEQKGCTPFPKQK